MVTCSFISDRLISVFPALSNFNARFWKSCVSIFSLIHSLQFSLWDEIIVSKFLDWSKRDKASSFPNTIITLLHTLFGNDKKISKRFTSGFQSLLNLILFIFPFFLHFLHLLMIVLPKKIACQIILNHLNEY